MHIKITLSLLFAIITVNHSENKFGSFKNGTKATPNRGGDQTEVMKAEIKKFLTECGADVSGEATDSKNSRQNNSNSMGYRTSGDDYYQNRGNSGENWNQRNNQNNRRGSSGQGGYGGNSDYYNSGGGYSTYGASGGASASNQQGGATGYGSWGGSNSGQSYGSRNQSGYNGNYGYGHESDGFGSQNGGGMDTNNRRSDYGSGSYGAGSGSGRDGFGYGGGYLRPRRSGDENECISQCVFGYLEVLDDNRSPSETAVIRWLHEHVPNDSKRIKIIRETRRCFARLAASDNDDGCQFSKSLSNCLNLDIEN